MCLHRIVQIAGVTPDITAIAGKIATIARNIEPGKVIRRHNCVKKFHSFSSGFYTRNKSTVFLHIFRHLNRINCYSGIEVSKHNN